MGAGKYLGVLGGAGGSIYKSWASVRVNHELLWCDLEFMMSLEWFGSV